MLNNFMQTENFSLPTKTRLIFWSLLSFSLSVAVALSTHLLPHFAAWSQILNLFVAVIFGFAFLLLSKSAWKGIALMVLSVGFSLWIAFSNFSWFGQHQVIDTVSQELKPFTSSVEFTSGTLQPKLVSFSYVSRTRSTGGAGSASHKRIYAAPFVFGNEKVKYIAIHDGFEPKLSHNSLTGELPFFEIFDQNPKSALVFKADVDHVDDVLRELRKTYTMDIDEHPIFLSFTNIDSEQRLSNFRQRCLWIFLGIVVVIIVFAFLPDKKKSNGVGK